MELGGVLEQNSGDIGISSLEARPSVAVRAFKFKGRHVKLATRSHVATEHERGGRSKFEEVAPRSVQFNIFLR